MICVCHRGGPGIFQLKILRHPHFSDSRNFLTCHFGGNAGGFSRVLG